MSYAIYMDTLFSYVSKCLIIYDISIFMNILYIFINEYWTAN